MRTISYYREKYGGIVLGIIALCVVWLINPNLNKCVDMMKEIPTIGMCTFGFLLTFLSIILQGNSDIILWMKSRKMLFNRFVLFNKRIVIIALLLSALSYFIGYFDFN